MKLDLILKKYKNIVLPVLITVGMVIGLYKLHSYYSEKHEKDMESVDRLKKMQEVASQIKYRKKQLEDIRNLFFPDSFTIISSIEKYARENNIEVISLNPVEKDLFGRNEEITFVVLQLRVKSPSIEPLFNFLRKFGEGSSKIISVMKLNLKGNEEGDSIESDIDIVGGVREN